MQLSPPSSSGLRDPWVRPGLALLGLLTILSVLLYRASPQSAAEATSRGWVAVAPDAFTPRIARARERAEAAGDALARGDTAAAVARLAEGEAEAWSARDRAPDTAGAARATELWAGMVLDRAELMLRTGTAPWWRADNEQLLGEALAAVQRLQGVPLQAATRQRADRVAAEIQRRLRPGPLEWLPVR
jgi:hypothetical protein